MERESGEEAVALLLDLERRVRQDPALAREWGEAWASFARGAEDAALQARFREWFLLERTSSRLGVPPASLWAPQSMDPDGAWARLLDSFLGIFRRVGVTDDGALVLEDLWTGRSILFRAAVAGDWQDESTLAIGRFILTREGWHEPLPGLFVIRAPGLVGAVERDLREVRARNPRRRLSQLECERLFAPFLPPGCPASLEELERQISGALGEEEGWDLAAVRDALKTSGAAGTLDLLAFHTTADLESLRRLLPEYEERLLTHECEAQHGGRAQQSEPPAQDVGSALAHFEAGRTAGRPLDELFGELERELGLQPGCSLTGEAELPQRPRRYAPDFGTWIQTYAWEREASARPLEAAEAAALQSFRSFLSDGLPEGLELRDLEPHLVVGYLLTASSATELAALRRSLEPFLDWASREQEASLEGLLERLRGPLGQRLGRVADCNASLRATAPPPRQRASVTCVQPLRVSGADATDAPADGLPDSFLDLPRPGDLLVGAWRGQTFRVSALLPMEALPPRKPPSPGDSEPASANPP